MTTAGSSRVQDPALQKVADDAFDKSRSKMVCQSCGKKNTFNKDTVKGHRRYKCKSKSCNHTIGIKELFTILKVDHPIMSSSTASKDSVPDHNDVDDEVRILKRRKRTARVLSSDDDHLAPADDDDEVNNDAFCNNQSLQDENLILKSRVASLESQLTLITCQNDKLSAQVASLTETVMKLTEKIQHDDDVVGVNVVKPPVESSIGPKRDDDSSKPSYASIVRSCNVPDAQAADAMKSLNILRNDNRRVASRYDSDCTNIYVSNLPYIRISELKSHLFKLHFVLSKIHHISYVSKTTVEFLVSSYYVAAFINKCNTCGLSVLKKYDATKPFDVNASWEVKNRIRQAFAARVRRIAMDVNSSEAAKSFYAKWHENVLGSSVAECALVDETEDHMNDV
jgi:hypothetical protein